MKFTSVALILLGACAHGDVPVSQKRIEILRKLNAQHYFRYDSCRSVSDEFLNKFGLPKLGQKLPSDGRRGPFARPEPIAERPGFRDEINSKDLKIQIAARPLNGKTSWQLHVRRVHAKTKHEFNSDFIFDETVSARGHKSCELTTISFHLTNSPADAQIKPEQVNIRECIDLYLSAAGATRPEIEWMKTDCALALHYATEAKRALGLQAP